MSEYKQSILRIIDSIKASDDNDLNQYADQMNTVLVKWENDKSRHNKLAYVLDHRYPDWCLSINELVGGDKHLYDFITRQANIEVYIANLEWYHYTDFEGDGEEPDETTNFEKIFIKRAISVSGMYERGEDGICLQEEILNPMDLRRSDHKREDQYTDKGYLYTEYKFSATAIMFAPSSISLMRWDIMGTSMIIKTLEEQKNMPSKQDVQNALKSLPLQTMYMRKRIKHLQQLLVALSELPYTDHFADVIRHQSSECWYKQPFIKAIGQGCKNFGWKKIGPTIKGLFTENHSESVHIDIAQNLEDLFPTTFNIDEGRTDLLRFLIEETSGYYPNTKRFHACAGWCKLFHEAGRHDVMIDLLSHVTKNVRWIDHSTLLEVTKIAQRCISCDDEIRKQLIDVMKVAIDHVNDTTSEDDDRSNGSDEDDNDNRPNIECGCDSCAKIQAFIDDADKLCLIIDSNTCEGWNVKNIREVVHVDHNHKIQSCDHEDGRYIKRRKLDREKIKLTKKPSKVECDMEKQQMRDQLLSLQSFVLQTKM